MEGSEQHARTKTLALYAAAFLLPALLLATRVGPARMFSEVPIDFRGDALYQCMHVKALMDGDSFRNVDRFAAPFGADLRIHPLTCNLVWGLVYLATRATDHFGQAINLVWVFRLMFCGLCGAWALRRLGIPRAIALVMAVLYAVSMYALHRNIRHFSLGLDFAPIVAAVFLLLVLGRFNTLKWHDKALFYLAMICVGLNESYMAFFSCFLLALAATASLLVSERRRQALPALFCLGALLGAAVPNTFLSIQGARQDSPRAFAALGERTAQGVQTFGLSVAALAAPPQGHPVAAFRELGQQVRKISDYTGEQNAEYIGVIALIGCAAALLALIRAMVPPGHLASTEASLLWPGLQAAGIGIACLILFAMRDGLIHYPALLGFSVFRAYARVSLFISFFSYFALALLLHEVHRRWIASATLPGRAAFAVFLAGLLAVGWLDQQGTLSLPREADHARQRADFAEAKDYVTRVERVLPEDALVYQFPSRYSNKMVGGWNIYDNTIPPLFAKTTRWSATIDIAQSDACDDWLRRVNSVQGFDALVRNILLSGFDGIAIDRIQFADPEDYARLLAAVEGISEGDTIVSSNGRFLCANMAAARRALAEELGAAEYHRQRSALVQLPSSRLGSW